MMSSRWWVRMLWAVVAVAAMADVYILLWNGHIGLAVYCAIVTIGAVSIAIEFFPGSR